MNRSLIQKPEKFRFNTILIDEPMIGNQYLTYDGITVLINGISDKYEPQFGTFYKIVMFNKHTHTSEMLAHYHMADWRVYHIYLSIQMAMLPYKLQYPYALRRLKNVQKNRQRQRSTNRTYCNCNTRCCSRSGPHFSSCNAKLSCSETVNQRWFFVVTISFCAD